MCEYINIGTMAYQQWRPQELSLRAIAKWVWGRKSASEVQERSLVGGLGDKVPQKLKQFADHCLQSLSAETVKI